MKTFLWILIGAVILWWLYDRYYAQNNSTPISDLTNLAKTTATQIQNAVGSALNGAGQSSGSSVGFGAGGGISGANTLYGLPQVAHPVDPISSPASAATESYAEAKIALPLRTILFSAPKFPEGSASRSRLFSLIARLR